MKLIIQNQNIKKEKEEAPVIHVSNFFFIRVQVRHQPQPNIYYKNRLEYIYIYKTDRIAVTIILNSLVISIKFTIN